jgi:hypothetical protein
MYAQNTLRLATMKVETVAYLDEVCSIPQVIHNVLHQTLSFLWLQGLLPEN